MSEFNKLVGEKKEIWTIVVDDQPLGVLDAPQGYDMQEIVDEGVRFAQYKFPDKAVVNFYLNTDKDEVKIWMGPKTDREEWWTL